MANYIKTGTRVHVEMVPIPGGNASFEAVLVCRPDGTAGDTFCFRLDDGRITEINPNASTFEGVTEVKAKDAAR